MSDLEIVFVILTLFSLLLLGVAYMYFKMFEKKRNLELAINKENR